MVVLHACLSLNWLFYAYMNMKKVICYVWANHIGLAQHTNFDDDCHQNAFHAFFLFTFLAGYTVMLLKLWRLLLSFFEYVRGRDGNYFIVIGMVMCYMRSRVGRIFIFFCLYSDYCFCSTNGSFHVEMAKYQHLCRFFFFFFFHSFFLEKAHYLVELHVVMRSHAWLTVTF